jgi:hypothetical protein
VLAAAALIARGIFLGRPVTTRHAMGAVGVLCAGLCARVVSLGLLGNSLVAGSGLVLMWPTTARPQPDALRRVWALVNATHADPLAHLLRCSRERAATSTPQAQRRWPTAPAWASRSSAVTR